MTRQDRHLQKLLGMAAISIFIRTNRRLGFESAWNVREIVEGELMGVCTSLWSDFDVPDWCEFVREGVHRAISPDGPAEQR